MKTAEKPRRFTLTLTPEKGQPFDLHLTDQGSGTYSAVINRYKEV